MFSFTSKKLEDLYQEVEDEKLRLFKEFSDYLKKKYNIETKYLVTTVTNTQNMMSIQYCIILTQGH